MQMSGLKILVLRIVSLFWIGICSLWYPKWWILYQSISLGPFFYYKRKKIFNFLLFQSITCFIFHKIDWTKTWAPTKTKKLHFLYLIIYILSMFSLPCLITYLYFDINYIYYIFNQKVIFERYSHTVYMFKLKCKKSE